MNDIYKEIKQCHLYAYRVCENGVAFMGNAEEKLEVVLEKVKSSIESKYGNGNISVETKLFAGNKTVTKYRCMQNIIMFCAEIGSRLAYIDYLTNIYNRNALERDLNQQQENGSKYYFIADLNNLKIVNDTIGHSAGDKMLQAFACLLTDAVGADGRAYRQGGDEFAVLYTKSAQDFVCKLEERCREYNESCTVPIRYAIGYWLDF